MNRTANGFVAMNGNGDRTNIGSDNRAFMSQATADPRGMNAWSLPCDKDAAYQKASPRTRPDSQFQTRNGNSEGDAMSSDDFDIFNFSPRMTPQPPGQQFDGGDFWQQESLPGYTGGPQSYMQNLDFDASDNMAGGELFQREASSRAAPAPTDQQGAFTVSPKDTTQKAGSNSVQIHHGQITPPDDHHAGFDGESHNEDEMEIEEEESKTKAHDGKAKPRSKAGRKSTKRKTGDAKEDEKRNKFLERNRLAASKCRMKKKEWTNNLEDRARDAQVENKQMRMIVDSLRQEVLYLKGEVLKHTDCECTGIREYLAREATQLALTGGHSTFAGGGAPHLESVNAASTRNNSIVASTPSNLSDISEAMVD